MSDESDSMPLVLGGPSAEDDLVRLRAAVQSYHDAYPENLFPPLTKDEFRIAVDALREAGVTSERLHADWSRRMVASVFRIAAEAE